MWGQINHYPADKHYQNQLSYPVDSGARINNQSLKSQTLDHCGFNKQIIIATVINTVGWAITEKTAYVVVC